MGTNDADDIFREVFSDFRSIRKHHEELGVAFSKLLADPTSKVPQQGDRVVVAIGLLSMGHLWVRGEGVVLECGETSYKVQLDKDECSRPIWVHQALIVEVLGPADQLAKG